MCLSSSVAYSLISFLIELNVKTKEDCELNFYWTKTISYIIALFLAIVSEYSYKTISIILSTFLIKDVIIIIGLEIIIALLENFYYYLKIKLITHYTKNGSIVSQFLDIIRRFTLIILGVLFFSETYTNIIYLSLVLMFVGSLIGLIDWQDLQLYWKKYIIKSNYEIKDISNIEIVCENL